MNDMNDFIHFLHHSAYNVRRNVLRMTSAAGSGHPTSCLSAADLAVVLFFYGMHFDPNVFDAAENDRFILSKGHASPLLYALWHELGKVSSDELLTYRSLNSTLEGHPTTRFPYAETATGSLGIGLSIGLGQALYAQMNNLSYRVFVLLGDAEISEGSVWESILLAMQYNVKNLVALIDVNRLGQTTETPLATYCAHYIQMVQAAGWKTFEVNGHDIEALIKLFDQIRTESVPVAVFAHTIKGYGVPFVADRLGFHGKAFSQTDLHNALNQLQEQAEEYALPNNYEWEPKYSAKREQKKQIASPERPALSHQSLEKNAIATRMAYGMALTELAEKNHTIIALDAEVKNSTGAEIFEKKYPSRFIQCYVAEQNMVGMAVGLYTRGATPFLSTFAAFLTRAHDQIRMAAIGRAALRITGSHAGISIGQDGPSQMGLEDIALMRALPDSAIFYPCDFYSTRAILFEMLCYKNGISYLRTTREETPILYTANDHFPLGKHKIVRKSDTDVACIIGAGITVFEALKAYEQLKTEGILCRVVDLYCIKPLDRGELLETVKNAQSRVVVVEDHYAQGGIGEMLAGLFFGTKIKFRSLAVNGLPCSGKPEELRALFKIDAAAIVASTKQLL
jgi:transketolase